MPLRCHEMIYIFNNCYSYTNETDNNHEARDYACRIYKHINKKKTQIKNDLGNRGAEHFLRYDQGQFSPPTRETYDKFIELYKIDEMNGFINYDELLSLFERTALYPVFNIQKEEGKPYKQVLKKIKSGVYGDVKEKKPTDNNDVVMIEGRNPRSILKINHDADKLHPTQKPIKLCEWLIKSYSNENDLILDFCMGSGTTVLACINTNRNYIGIEKDKEIFKIAEQRIKTHIKPV
jgi:site-specific DNA-methyltransferase (adenine-specific)